MVSSELSYLTDEVALRIYHLRKGGMHFADIADMVGIEFDICVRLFRNYQKRAVESYSGEERQSLIQLELDRLDSLQLAVWAAAMDGDTKAVDSVLKVMDRRSKLLGLDSVDPTTNATTANILIVGDNDTGFIEALNSGRKKLTRPPSEDEGDDREQK